MEKQPDTTRRHVTDDSNETERHPQTTDTRRREYDESGRGNDRRRENGRDRRPNREGDRDRRQFNERDRDGRGHDYDRNHDRRPHDNDRDRRIHDNSHDRKPREDWDVRPKYQQRIAESRSLHREARIPAPRYKREAQSPKRRDRSGSAEVRRSQEKSTRQRAMEKHRDRRRSDTSGSSDEEKNGTKRPSRCVYARIIESLAVIGLTIFSDHLAGHVHSCTTGFISSSGLITCISV